MADKLYIVTNKKTDKILLTTCKMFRLEIHIIAYMNCFPDSISDGAPSNVFEKNVTNSPKNLTFYLSDSITEKGSSPITKIPHFRKGHFSNL